MQKERIHEMVDKNIIKSFSEGIALSIIQKELGVKVKNFTTTFEKDPSVNLSELMKLDFNELGPTRTRYGVTYLKHCKKRIEDLNWIVENKSKFRHLSNSQVFRLLQLRDKLSKENAISLPF